MIFLGNVKTPTRATEHSVGYDLYTPYDITLPPFTTTKVATGLSIQMPAGRWAKLEARSSLAAKGVLLLGGVIDPDYTGEIKVILHNLGRDRLSLPRHARIAQMVFHPMCTLGDEVKAMREGGLGSTGE